MFTALAGRPDAAIAAACDAVCPCVGTQTSQRSARTSAVQFIGSIQAWARNGTSNTRSNDLALFLIAAFASPSLRATFPGCSASAAYFFEMSALLSLERGP